MSKNSIKEEVYFHCKSDGMFIPKINFNIEKIKSMVKIAEEDLMTIKELDGSNRFNTLYKLSYDVIHILAEALVLFFKIKSRNHKCLFSYICVNLNNFDWDFFEMIRIKRNGINYYGSEVSKDDWEKFKVQLFFYINLLKSEIEKRINSL